MMEKKKESRLRFSQVKLTSWLSNLRRRSTQPASTTSEPNLSSVSDHSFHRKLNGTQDSDHNLRRISCIETEKTEAFAEFDFPRSSCGSCRSSISVNSSDFEIQNIGENRIPEPRMFSDMLSEIKRSREIAGKFKISLENKAEGRRSDTFKDFVSDSRSGKEKRGDRRRGKDENQRRGASRSAQIRMERKMEIKVCSPMREEKNAGVAGSFAVVKSSSDPLRDFRESMVEMISENRIEGPEELEDLLACYLSLNSDEHHDVIVKAFRLVWFELNRVCTG